MKWNDLSMRQRAALFQYALNNGIDVSELKNKFDNGGKIPTREEIIKAAWDNENPNRKGKNKDGTYSQYPDPNGKGMDVGPGLLVGKGIKDQKTYTQKEVEDAAYKFGASGLKAIGDEYNAKYGSKAMPSPWDTVSAAPKMLMLDTRYQNGNLPQSKWPSLYQAVADGNWGEAIKQSRSTFTDKKNVKHYDNDRVRRRAETLFPGMFDVTYIKDSKTMPEVKKKEKVSQVTKKKK